MMSPPDIYLAKYSGVAVFEMVINDVAVMIRRSDSYLNATQILKLAGIDKGKRTKILEREILTGTHEKVQGGYGKYQGTWIPREIARELAERYKVLHLILPIVEFDPTTIDAVREETFPTKEQVIAAQRRRMQSEMSSQAFSFPSQVSSSPSPLYSAASPSIPSPSYSSQPQTHDDYRPVSSKQITIEQGDQELLRSALSSTFLTDDIECILRIQNMLQTSRISKDFVFSIVLDEKGNTVLHYAATLAYMNTMEELVSSGASTNCINYDGETALMLAVKTNKYDERTFHKLIDILGSSLTVVDKNNRNILHHIVLDNGPHGHLYMQILLNSTNMNESILSVLRSTDSDGKTALTLARRLDRNDLVRLLDQSEQGAPMEEDDTGSIFMDTSSTMSAEAREAQSDRAEAPQEQTFKSSQRGRDLVSSMEYWDIQKNANKALILAVQKIVDALDADYEQQLAERDRELRQARDELEKMKRKLEETQKRLEARQQQHTVPNTQSTERTVLDANTIRWDLMGSKETDLHVLLSVDDTTTTRERRLQEYVLQLQSRLEEQVLAKAQAEEKEWRCKRLISSCCNVPLEKIDDLIEPLTMAVESDPPDLELPRVIGFMETIRRQNAERLGTGHAPGKVLKNSNIGNKNNSISGTGNNSGNDINKPSTPG